MPDVLRRRRWLLALAALLLVVLASGVAACSGSGGTETPERSQGVTLPVLALDGDDAAPAVDHAFRNDPTLKRFLLRGSALLPARFREVARDDREPILALGLVSGAARATYSSPTTGEIIAVDVLRLEDRVEREPFFAAFADALVDNASFRSVSRIGVVRGIGERARRYTFFIEGDRGEAAAILRDRVIVLLTYRRPFDRPQPVDVGDLLRALDEMIQA